MSCRTLKEKIPDSKGLSILKGLKISPFLCIWQNVEIWLISTLYSILFDKITQYNVKFDKNYLFFF